MDCGPSCLKNIAKFHGKYYSLQFLRDKCGINKEGASLYDLSRGAESIGLKTLAVKLSIDDFIAKVSLPCIIHWENHHFVVCYAVKGQYFYISNPARGLQKLNRNEFIKFWLSGKSEIGSVLIVEPTDEFYNNNNAEKPRSLKIFDSVINYVKPYRASVYNIAVLMFVVTILQAFLPFVSKAVIDVGIQTSDLHFINLVLIANSCIILSIALSNAARDWILLHVTSRINIALISDYLIKLLKLPVSFFENKMVGDILQRASDLERIRSFILNNSLSTIFSLITFSIFSVILAIYSFLIFLIFCVGSLLYFSWVIFFVNLRKKTDWEYFDLQSRNQSFWVETVSAINDIKLNNYETPKRWKWEAIQAKLFKVQQRMLVVQNYQTTGAQAIDSMKNLLITFVAAKQVINGEISFGVMVSVQFIIGMLSAPIAQFITFVVGLQYAKISYLRIREIHEMKSEDDNLATDSLALSSNKDLILKQASFGYQLHGPLSVKNVNLVIPYGKVTAIVGDSGSGKSTLMKLLLRLYKPTHGEILLGNKNIENISLKSWRDECGAVLQDGKIFNDTILNNIVLDDENVNYNYLKTATDTANITSEIEGLPLGYHTVMGEMGRGLSGGQKQRILIARALYKNPSFLFFDEATNALDSINEKKIVDALDQIFHAKTVVIIAHRLSTIKKADQIIVMKDGSVCEMGNHVSLLAKKGHYYHLVLSQFEQLASEDNSSPIQGKKFSDIL